MDVKKRSQVQEKRTAKDLNGKVTPASGALWGAKGDVRSKRFLVECKTTEKSFYSLTANIWCKISQEAVNDNLRTPVMCIEVHRSQFAVVDKGTVSDIFNSNKNAIQVTCKSFRITEDLIDRVPLYIVCSNPAWGRYPQHLALMSWEQFCEAVDKLEEAEGMYGCRK